MIESKARYAIRFFNKLNEPYAFDSGFPSYEAAVKRVEEILDESMTGAQIYMLVGDVKVDREPRLVVEQVGDPEDIPF